VLIKLLDLYLYLTDLYMMPNIRCIHFVAQYNEVLADKLAIYLLGITNQTLLHHWRMV